MTLSKTIRTFDYIAVTNGTTYSYLVVATNAIGASSPSNETSATPTGSTTVSPSAPTSVTATNPAGNNHLQWNPPSSSGGAPITSYRVYRGTAPGAEAATPVGTVSTTSFDDVNGLAGGTTYYYVVPAVNQAGKSSVHRGLDHRYLRHPGPAQLSSTTVSGPGVRLDWTLPPDGGSAITRYVVVRDGVRLVTLTATPTSRTPTPRSCPARPTATR